MKKEQKKTYPSTHHFTYYDVLSLDRTYFSLNTLLCAMFGVVFGLLKTFPGIFISGEHYVYRKFQFPQNKSCITKQEI